MINAEKRGHSTLLILGVLLVGVILFSSFASAGFWDYLKGKITGKATTSPLDINITLGNTAPTITNVQVASSINPSENTVAYVWLNFTANDADGIPNLNYATATVNISNGTHTNAVLRTNSSCSPFSTADSTTRINFTCKVDLWFFDSPATNGYVIRARILDQSSSEALNLTKNFTVGTVGPAMTASLANFTFASVNPGATNTVSLNDPLILNNTGNIPIGMGYTSPKYNITMNATNLVGEETSTQIISASNFTLHTATGGSVECTSGTVLAQSGSSKYQNISGAVLSVGNYTPSACGAGSCIGQEQLYACIKGINSDISSQSYSTRTTGSWVLSIVN